MAATTLDPKTALVVVDLQKGVVGRATAHPVDEVVARAEAGTTDAILALLGGTAG
jgi:hypothetical protein